MRKISALTHISAFCWTGGSGEEIEGRWGCRGCWGGLKQTQTHRVKWSMLPTAKIAAWWLHWGVCVCVAIEEMEPRLGHSRNISKSATDEGKWSCCTKADSDVTLSSIVSSLICNLLNNWTLWNEPWKRGKRSRAATDSDAWWPGIHPGPAQEWTALP